MAANKLLQKLSLYFIIKYYISKTKKKAHCPLSSWRVFVCWGGACAHGRSQSEQEELQQRTMRRYRISAETGGGFQTPIDNAAKPESLTIDMKLS